MTQQILIPKENVLQPIESAIALLDMASIGIVLNREDIRKALIALRKARREIML